jgi:hypothetical protein
MAKTMATNGPRVEMLTADKAGFTGFLRDLKRAKVAHAQPASELEEALGRPLKPREYERLVTAGVEQWEKRQAESVEAQRKEGRAKKLEAATSGDNEAALQAIIQAPLVDLYADKLAATFASVRCYLGKLNRDVNDSRVAEYQTAMEDGRWWFTPDPIVVTTEGAIINGQHRLLAVERVLNGKPIPEAFVPPQFVVVWNVDKKAALLMDEARRTATDRRDIALRFASA